jgi:very-long-chain (3R)-3-hydroxyacyl-CoA dehydratase
LGLARNTDGIFYYSLLAYNAASFAAWALVLERVIRHVIWPTWPTTVSEVVERASTGAADFGLLTKQVQLAAALEPVHVVLGLVRSGLATTAMQVASRLWLVSGLLRFFPEVSLAFSISFLYLLLNYAQQVASNPLYTSMVFAWSLTETIRFATYSTGQLGFKFSLLEYLRYTLFYVLYPMGAGSEAFLMYAAVPYVPNVSYHSAFWNCRQVTRFHN